MSISISNALRDPNLLGATLQPVGTWATWLAVLAAAFAEPLTADEAVAFATVAGGRQPPGKRIDELYAVVGRRGGKSRTAAVLACYLAVFQQHRLAPGERGHVLCLSASKAQAQLIHGYIRAFLEASPVLCQQIASVTAETIELRNGIVIGVHSNSFRTVRGRTIVAAIFDELAYWTAEDSANPDVETFRAVKPALDASNGMLICISSPYRKVGLLATKYAAHFGKDTEGVLVVQAPSMIMNPTLSEKKIARPTCCAAATMTSVGASVVPAATWRSETCRYAFSTITIDASTRTPMASARPPSDMMFDVMPR